MFDEPFGYPKERVKTFLRYLVNAARKVDPGDFGIGRQNNNEKLFRGIEARASNLTSDRKDELEIKIKAFYTKNKYMPLEVKLKKLKEKFNILKREKKGSTKKIERIEEKITRCQELLKRIKRIDMMNNQLNVQ